jgi:hypothetical protein
MKLRKKFAPKVMKARPRRTEAMEERSFMGVCGSSFADMLRRTDGLLLLAIVCGGCDD